jgi:hypothetical protein
MYTVYETDVRKLVEISKTEKGREDPGSSIYNVCRNFSLTPHQLRKLSSAVTNAITSYLETGSLKPTEPRQPSDVSVETPRHSISHIEPEPSTSIVRIIDTPQRSIKEDGDGDYAVKDYGVVASPYVKPNFSIDRSLHSRYGLGREGDNFMIGDSKVIINEDSDMTIKGKHFEGTQGLWELLILNSVYSKVITLPMRGFFSTPMHT